MTKSKSLLIIEDDPDLRMTLEYFLGKIGYQVLTAKNCEDGIKTLASHHPRAVLCDIMLPGMDGYEACKKIKADAAIRDTVVIFISARDTSEIERKGAEVAADFYVPKPVDPNDVGADLYYLFEQDFHLSPDEMKKLRVMRRIPARSSAHASSQGIPHELHHAHKDAPASGYDEEFEFGPPSTHSHPHSGGHHHSDFQPTRTQAPAPIDAESMANLSLSEVHQLLVALRDSLKDTGQRLDAILQYIEVMEE